MNLLTFCTDVETAVARGSVSHLLLNLNHSTWGVIYEHF